MKFEKTKPAVCLILMSVTWIIKQTVFWFKTISQSELAFQSSPTNDRDSVFHYQNQGGKTTQRHHTKMEMWCSQFKSIRHQVLQMSKFAWKSSCSSTENNAEKLNIPKIISSQVSSNYKSCRYFHYGFFCSTMYFNYFTVRKTLLRL